MCHILRTLTRSRGRSTRFTSIAATTASRAPTCPTGCGSCAAARGSTATTTLGREIYDSLHRRSRGRPLPAGARHLALHPRRDRSRTRSAQGRRRGEYDSAFSAETDADLRLVPRAEPLNYALDNDSPHAGPSNRSTSRPARSSSSAASCGAACISASATAPTWPSWTASRGWTSTIRRISQWPRSSPQPQPAQILLRIYRHIRRYEEGEISIPPFSFSSGSSLRVPFVGVDHRPARSG